MKLLFDDRKDNTNILSGTESGIIQFILRLYVQCGEIPT